MIDTIADMLGPVATQLHSRSFMPDDEPFLSEWCKLDTLHQAALREDTSKSLLAACYLADAKYDVWLRWTEYAIVARVVEALAGDGQ